MCRGGGWIGYGVVSDSRGVPVDSMVKYGGCGMVERKTEKYGEIRGDKKIF